MDRQVKFMQFVRLFAKQLLLTTRSIWMKRLRGILKKLILRYDRTLFVAGPRRCEPKKYGGRGARGRARTQKSYS